jgi:DNA-binding transcriptional regulator YiaG
MTTLLRIRKQHRIKRSQIAHWTQLDYSTLYRWETGKAPYPHFAELLYQSYVKEFRPLQGGCDAGKMAA